MVSIAAALRRFKRDPLGVVQRGMIDQMAEGMVLKPAVKYQRVAQAAGVPEDDG